jgi:hypothetical protein
MRKMCTLGLMAFSATTLAAYADVIPTLSSITPSGSDFTWNYSANVTADQRVEHNDFFTIYDFGSFVPGSNTQPTGWMFSSSLLGSTPSFLTARDYARLHDNPSVLNLTWTYIGQNPIIGPDFLGIFSVTNNTNQLTTGQFASQATHNGGPYNGGKSPNLGDVSVPVPEMSALLPILSVCSAGLLALLPSLLRRRQTS